MAQRCGLKPEVEVMCGASDGCLAAYAGYISTGIRNSLTIGTSAAVRKVSETTVFDRQKQNFCYYLQDDLYVVGAPSNNGGCVLAWAKETLSEDPDAFYHYLPQVMEESPIGSNGLRFSLFKRGAGTFWTNEITGGFFWLDLETQSLRHVAGSHRRHADEHRFIKANGSVGRGSHCKWWFLSNKTFRANDRGCWG